MRYRPLSRQTATLLAAGIIAGAGVIFGFVLLLSPVTAPIGPISGPDGYVARLSCGNAFTAPYRTGIFADIDAETGGPGIFQRMADHACSRAKAPRRYGGGTLAVAGVLALVGVGRKANRG